MLFRSKIDQVKMNEWPNEEESCDARLEIDYVVSGTDEVHKATGCAKLTTEAGYTSSGFTLN